VTGWWERHVLPRVIDRCCGVAPVARLRAELCAPLSGQVLEIGFGTGLNVPHYPPAVEQVAAVEPNDRAWAIAQRRLRGSTAAVRRTGLDGQRLGEPDAGVDHVLSTFTMCTIPDLDAALSEARRVLRPGGRLHFLEHGLAPDPGVRRWQRRLEPVQRRVAGGCHLTRRPDAALEAAGFEVLELATAYLPGPAVGKPLTFLYRGVAERRG
jgi:SAM-dependent methyltransferase